MCFRNHFHVFGELIKIKKWKILILSNLHKLKYSRKIKNVYIHTFFKFMFIFDLLLKQVSETYFFNSLYYRYKTLRGESFFLIKHSSADVTCQIFLIFVMLLSCFLLCFRIVWPIPTSGIREKSRSARFTFLSRFP